MKATSGPSSEVMVTRMDGMDGKAPPVDAEQMFQV